MNRGLSGSGNQSGGLHVPPPGFNTQSRLPSSFKMEHNSPPSFRHDMNTDGGGGGGGVVSITTPGSGNGSDLGVKKTRGRTEEDLLKMVTLRIELVGSVSQSVQVMVMSPHWRCDWWQACRIHLGTGSSM